MLSNVYMLYLNLVKKNKTSVITTLYISQQLWHSQVVTVPTQTKFNVPGYRPTKVNRPGSQN
uniref:Uncharacterized protein n=1 Tax=Arion vulgaris TaxID=1028688 RepID=A0A0B7AMT7_9EUPU